MAAQAQHRKVSVLGVTLAEWGWQVGWGGSRGGSTGTAQAQHGQWGGGTGTARGGVAMAEWGGSTSTAWGGGGQRGQVQAGQVRGVHVSKGGDIGAQGDVRFEVRSGVFTSARVVISGRSSCRL